MYCPKCGTENDDNAYRCVDCSGIIQVVAAQSAVRPIEEDPGMRMLLPVGRSLLAIIMGVVFSIPLVFMVIGILSEV